MEGEVIDAMKITAGSITELMLDGCTREQEAYIKRHVDVKIAKHLREAAKDWTAHQQAHMGKGTVEQIAVWLTKRAKEIEPEPRKLELQTIDVSELRNV